jgi:hypothetical protein
MVVCKEDFLHTYVVGGWEYIEFAEGQLTKCRFSAWSERGVTAPVCEKKNEDDLIRKGNTELC